MATIKLKTKAALEWWSSIIPKNAPQWFPSHNDWQYRGALEKLADLELPLVAVKGGVEGCVYALMPETKAFKRFRSHVIAIPRTLAAELDETNLGLPPIEESGSGAWWKKEGLEVVRLLTFWVDGFMAFTPSQRIPTNHPEVQKP